MVRKGDLTAIGTHRKGMVVKHVGKGATEQHLGAAQRQTLTPGALGSRTMNDYAKESPMIPSPPPGNSGMSLSNQSGEVE